MVHEGHATAEYPEDGAVPMMFEQYLTYSDIALDQGRGALDHLRRALTPVDLTGSVRHFPKKWRNPDLPRQHKGFRGCRHPCCEHPRRFC